MTNTFKVGDYITVNADDVVNNHCARDTTIGKAYKLEAIDTPQCNEAEPHDVQFTDDVGDTVILFPEHVTLVS
jgi:hypothetical protein